MKKQQLSANSSTYPIAVTRLIRKLFINFKEKNRKLNFGLGKPFGQLKC